MYYSNRRYGRTVGCRLPAWAVPTWCPVATPPSARSAAYGLNGQWEQAAADGQKCVSLAPQFLKGYHRASNALKHLKKYDEAIKTIEKGLIHFQGERQRRSPEQLCCADGV